MPFFQTAPAAAGGGVLRDKHRMAAKRGLFAVVARLGGGQAFADKISGVAQYRFQAFAAQIIQILAI